MKVFSKNKSFHFDIMTNINIKNYSTLFILIVIAHTTFESLSLGVNTHVIH